MFYWVLQKLIYKNTFSIYSLVRLFVIFDRPVELEIFVESIKYRIPLIFAWVLYFGENLQYDWILILILLIEF